MTTTDTDVETIAEEIVADDGSHAVAIPTEDDDTLRAAVVETLSEILEEAPEADEDGEIPIWIDDVLTYATVDAESGFVLLTTYLVEGIAGRTRAAEVLGDLQVEFPEVKFVLDKDRVTVELRVAASPLVPIHLVRAVAALVPVVEQARALAQRLGGEASVFDGDPDIDEEDLLVDGCGCGDCDCG
ncbi:T3SS (YopN, CesT) and YbjN peptide-binding chaperone 1 [Rhodococcus sp. B50]|uniref:T3SS (YopN, CesT) and YbjN peptide-binding chaperone 1 n=1 Tax=Rhodococcus sp. B50 TaxID=2682847 RepID=UPI0019E7E8C3|nr:hypothetical protein [Rhodococcus sp. B50]MBS9371553.1 hypothetical protein [Rhodococcus sp. B50]